MTSLVPAVVRTPRLLLRAWGARDAEALQPLLVANVSRLAGWIPAHVSTPLPVSALEERLAGFAADFAADRAYRWAIRPWAPGEDGAPDAPPMGEIDLFPRATGRGRVALAEADHVELGYWLDAAATGSGIVTEAARAVLAQVESALPGMTHAEIRCDPANAESSAVARRLGFELAGIAEGGDELWRLPLPAPAST